MNTSPFFMRRFSLLIAFSVIAAVLCAQSTCEVWQWLGTDSANKILAKTERYNSRGQLVAERITGFQRELLFPAMNYETYLQYSDTLLKTWNSVADRDSSRIENAYDSLGRLATYTVYRRNYVLMDTVQSGMFVIDRVSLEPCEGDWKCTGVTSFTYDQHGRMTHRESKWSGTSSGSASRWEYDEQDRKTKEEYYLFGKLHWYYTVAYFDGGYTETYTWYNDKGKVERKPGRKSPQYMQKKTTIVKLDTQGRIVEERDVDQKGKQITRTTTSYNSEGKLERVVYYDEKDTAVLTHVYVYL